MFNLKDKIVLLAGGSGYLGSAVSNAFLEQGAKVIISDVRNPGKLQENVNFIECDISNESDINELQSYIERQCSYLDIAVNMTFSNAGKGFYEMEAEDWRRGIDVNLTGTFLLSRMCYNLMKIRKRGSIIHFSSMYGIVSPDPHIYPTENDVNPIEYGVGKAGVLQMTRYLAVKWAKEGIRVNAIAPGAFPNSKIQEDKIFIKKLESKIPIGRIGKPEEIAGAVVFLSSDEASYVTGQCIIVDGGWTIW